MLEGPPGIDIVARINAYLLAVLRSHIGDVCGEVYVGNQRLIIAVGLQTSRDMTHVLRLAGTLGCKPHQFTTGIDDTLGLGHTTLGIVGIHRRHRLDANGVVTTDGDVADMGNSGDSSAYRAHRTHRTNWSYRNILPLPNPCWPFLS